MRFLLSGFLLALSLPISSVLGAAAKGEYCCDNNQCFGHEVKCATGLSCCYQRPVWMESIGGTCYDAKTETCATCPVFNPNHPQTQVCPSSSPTCCGSCINSTLQCCHHYGSWNSFTCPAGKTCCGFSGSGACCDSTQNCINDVCVPKPSCPSGTLACGSTCYKSSEYACVDPSTSKLCPASAPSACGDACYSESQYTCQNGALSPKGSSNTQPPAPGCVMPGDLKCGGRCYNPSTHVCTNAGTEFLCPIAYPNQCGTACYSSTQYSCVNGQLKPVGSGSAVTQPPATTAPTAVPGCVLPGDLKCGSRCYKPSTHVCADAGSSFLCPTAYPSKCGAGCYSTSQYSCDNGQLKPVGSGSAGTQPPATSAPTAAPGCVMPGDLKCGTRCYSPVTHVCADAGSSFLCPAAFPSKCGAGCYSPSQYKCENGQLKHL